MIKATRRDGQNRFTLNIQFYPGREELIHIVVWMATRLSGDPIQHLPTNKQTVLDEAANAYKRWGSKMVETIMLEEGPLLDNVMPYAEKCVDQLFPELTHRELAKVGVKIKSGTARYKEVRNQSKLAKTNLGKRLGR
jgi:hypothetical protein